MAATKDPGSSPTRPPTYTAVAVEEQLQDLHLDLDPKKLASAARDLLPAQVVVHLKLLHAIQDLRNDISNQQDLWGISDSFLPAPQAPGTPMSRSLIQIEAARKKIQEKRWAVFVTRAVERFRRWWFALHAEYGNEPLRLVDFEDDGPGLLNSSAPDDFSKEFLPQDQLPPLDVLMVWHAFMLNPRCYLEDCLRQGMMTFWHRGMPWSAVDAAIDSSGCYDAGEPARSGFEALTQGLKWSNAQSDLDASFDCPACLLNDGKVMRKFELQDKSGRACLDHLVWSTVGAGLAAEHDNLQRLATGSDSGLEKMLELIDRILADATGVADPSFSSVCQSCFTDWTHDTLRGAKFVTHLKQFCRPESQKRDVFDASLVADVVPMPGTVLDEHGRPSRAVRFRGIRRESRSFPNRLADAVTNFDHPSGKKWSEFSLERIKEWELEPALRDWDHLAYCQGVSGPRRRRLILLPEERKSIRKMLSRYWTNSSPFALDLVGAVVRQGSFIRKMIDIDWLHSPTVMETASRILQKYSRFMTILAGDTTKMAVPTLDVDLGWHTHQLAPSNYYQSTVGKTKGVFIDHDDKVPETTLSDAFARTSEQYERLFGEPYSQCTCWYCESIRASHTSSTSRLFRRSSISQINVQLHDAPDDPSRSAHISAHNAITPLTDRNSYDVQRRVQMFKLRIAFDKARKRARKDGRPEPVLPPYMETTSISSSKNKNDYAYASAYAYGPAYMPVIPYYGYDCAPYMCDPNVAAGAYAANPACATLQQGAYGACCQGACGGTVAAGACSNAGLATAGGCSAVGGSGIGAGGCGGGGGGSGGGCGGGGGGGCGGGGGGGGGGCGGGGG